MASPVGAQRSTTSVSSFIFSPSSSSSDVGLLPPEITAGPPCAKILVAMLTVLEILAVIPTLWLEQRLGSAIEQFVLRLLLMVLRLFPLWRLLAAGFYRYSLRWCFGMLPFSLQWRCREWLQCSESCSRLPEVRWGLTVTLDLWFLLVTHMVAGTRGPMAAMSIALLFVNSLLCAFDLLALVCLLLHGKQRAEIYPEVTFQRPQAIKWSIPEEGADSTCTICLSEFGEGEPVQLMPCGHVFHTDCIAHWLRVSHHCPMRCPEFVLPPRSEPVAPATQWSESGAAESMVTQYDSHLLGTEGPAAQAEFIPELVVLPGEVPSRGSSASG